MIDSNFQKIKIELHDQTKYNLIRKLIIKFEDLDNPIIKLK